MGIKDINIGEADIIDLLRRETEEKLQKAAQMGAEGQLEGGKEGKAVGSVVSPGLKLRRKSDKALMTVDTVDDNQVVLRTPNGELYQVLSSELDDAFELD